MKMKYKTKGQLHVELPVGRVIAAAFASFAARGQPILEVTQKADGCIITVSIELWLWVHLWLWPTF
jgi:hypothetical protein